VTGRVGAESGGVPAIPAAGLRVLTIPGDPDGDVAPPSRPAPVLDGWTFELPNLAGARLFRLTGAPDGWALKAVMLGGRDVTDEPVDAAEAARGVEIVLTSRISEVSGAVTDDRGQAVKDYVVAIFSDDPRDWQMTQSRRLRSARPGQDGRFSVRGLPSGEYLAIALEYLEEGEATDPEALERWRTIASAVRIADGETKAVELKLAVRP
jgi:hypothetical protein